MSDRVDTEVRAGALREAAEQMQMTAVDLREAADEIERLQQELDQYEKGLAAAGVTLVEDELTGEVTVVEDKGWEG